MIHENFCWIATWKITDRCNLNCTYCDSSIMKRADAPENIDRFEALERIGSYRPHILNISGGEPALVKELPELLAWAKEKWNPFIRVVHNGTGPEKLEKAFPYMDRLVISIDGPGEVNKATRGLSGDTVLKKIKKMLNTTNQCPEVVVNTVVTEKNIDTLSPFAAQIAMMSPRILLALLPVMPIESSLSVLKNREQGYKRFLNVYADMKSAHSNVIHNFDCVMRHENLHKIQCYNQYFTVKFSPRGEFFACGANIASQIQRTDNIVKKILKKGGLKKTFTIFIRIFKNKMGKIDFTCRNMCNCESWLDMLFLGMNTGYAPIVLRGLKGRFNNNDYQKLNDFVKKNINKKFDINWFREMIEKNEN